MDSRKKSINQDVWEACILGWGPRLWRGAESLRSLDKARDGEPVEPLAGKSRRQRDRLVKWLKEAFCEVITGDPQLTFFPLNSSRFQQER